MRLVTAHVPNSPGMLARISANLAEAELDVFGFSADVNRLRILTDTAPAVVASLKDLGIVATEHRVLAVRLDDEPGRLAALTRRLADAEINIEAAFGASIGDQGTIYLRVDDHERAKVLLSDLAPKA